MPSGHPMNSDQELVSRAASGDSGAFGTLYDRYLDAIYRYVYYRVADSMEAEDLTEKVFLKALTGLANQKTELRNFRSWLFTIAHHEVVDHYRRRKELLSLESAHSLNDGTHTPEQEVEAREKAAQVALAIASLKPEYQQVITLRFINGLSHEETAKIMKLKEGHVRVLQYRALRRIREFLAQELVSDG